MSCGQCAAGILFRDKRRTVVTHRMNKTLRSLLSVTLLCSHVCHGQSPPLQSAQRLIPEKIIIDTDIGDDVDDALAVGLALRSPELETLGISTTFGDTETRAR